MLSIDELQDNAITLLQKLVRQPSFSGDEFETAEIISKFFDDLGIGYTRLQNNVLSHNYHFDHKKPTILLNSHHDTVKVVNGWSYDPHGADIVDGKMYGLGTNDAGASLVSLIATFVYFFDNKELPYNLFMAATAEEENFGPNGVRSLIDTELKDIKLGIVGEPTGMNMAIAEKGLLVIDAEAKGKAGHAARKEGENAIYKAIKDINIIKNYEFEKVSDVLGPNVITVTQVNGGYQHNVVPDSCKFVIDLRVNELYTLDEAFRLIDEVTDSELKARSFRNNPSGIDISHPIVQKGIEMGLGYYGSPTLSDQAHMNFPTVKIGPGESERSHTPNEFIMLDEIREGIEKYIEILSGLNLE